MKTSLALLGALAICASLAAPMAAAAPDDYPLKQRVTLVVPFPPGGLTDIVARRFAQRLQDETRQTVVVENKAGASGQLGTQAVSKAPADGYTLLVTATHFAVNSALRPTLPYDPLKDFTAIAVFLTTPNVLAVPASLPVHDLQEYLAYARQKGGLAFGSSGTGGSTHLSGELLKLATKAPLFHVPYKGMAPAINDLLGGQVPSVFLDPGSVVQFAKEGKVRLIGVTSSKRIDVLPDVPTIAEQGVPGYEANTWIALVAPAGVPASVVEKLNKVAVATVNTPDAKGWLTQSGAIASDRSPADAARFISAELSMWKRVVKEAAVKADD